jgi:REP element-mobilizing transposase RayT
MPDHVHLLLTGTDDNCALLPVINRWRQITGFIWRRQHESHLWQQGYWDRTLRDEDETLSVAAYIANNPIRSGLVDRLQDYPWVGSSEYTLEQLAEAVQIRPSGRG